MAQSIAQSLGTLNRAFLNQAQCDPSTYRFHPKVSLAQRAGLLSRARMIVSRF